MCPENFQNHSTIKLRVKVGFYVTRLYATADIRRFRLINVAPRAGTVQYYYDKGPPPCEMWGNLFCDIVITTTDRLTHSKLLNMGCTSDEAGLRALWFESRYIDLVAYCLFVPNKIIFFYFCFLCLFWHVIERCGWELSHAQLLGHLVVV